MMISDEDKVVLSTLREMLLRDVDEYQFKQLKEFRDKLVDEIRVMNFAITKLNNQRSMILKAKAILVASDYDSMNAVFDMLVHYIDREIAAIQPTSKMEKQLDLERRLATIQGKRQLAALLEGFIGKDNK
jgi:hypothetical protein